MEENPKEVLVAKLGEFVDGKMSYSELQKWLDYGGASQLAQRLSKREQLYYSWLRQRLDEENQENVDLKGEVTFFIRFLRGHVSVFERWRKWWSFR
jgi:hypothetical protein